MEAVNAMDIKNDRINYLSHHAVRKRTDPKEKNTSNVQCFFSHGE